MNTVTTITLTALLAVGAASAAAAQQPTPMDTTRRAGMSMSPYQYQRTIPDSLLSQVRISEDSARTLAIAKVPNGTVHTLVLQRARGKLFWTFTIKNPRKAGNTEVSVNALDGTIITEQKAS